MSALGKESGQQAWETGERHENEGMVVVVVGLVESTVAVKIDFLFSSCRGQM